ncbi:zinc-binding dehydrogenase [Roseobacter sp. HKCCD9010]|uniref:NADPH:quinone oxidoreductase family protein n=1 Tax=unclassified Roseobacter TaxID=196798 RepID=UPI00149225AC|nr:MULTISPECIES: NADPH:quinone oxidoreductase family protein [unclassified Roseobacter]MBF9049380.1 zinc-binding dehydrogenase [Rhodobacterales bacterium HKCCD4356]NNV11380.1 zinc-binding dehydrogenase [Roseobacter sp. HKCCD7357]NNV15564.1 zinc-binding dehydrogenase [Roseobacter sp. HKCCD8768]NNV25024.1 zinc-binding dehydrogenase [Roseobacter sp. HKCCD8192]NNV29281.1 zinc-binding dehydrogenase [Roseobacter sp. HKCCD9061]
MRAYRVSDFDSPPALAEIETLAPGKGEVLIEIAACGLNFADLLMIKGQYQDTPPPPFTLGMEIAGTVRGLGEGVSGPAIGTRVAVFAGQGGLAEFGCFPAARCIEIPDQMPFEDAAGFLIAYGTSHLALDHRARLQPGERLLVLGAAGGVGLTAVEIGARMGAEVIACARGAEKLAVAKAAGATHLIDSESSDLRAEVKALGGADVVYDAVGGDQFTAAMRATNPEGRILTIGFASGEVPKIPANHLLVKNISVIGLYWGGYMGFAPETLTRSLATLFDLYRDGGLRPHIGARFPLAEAGDALALLKARKSTGKVVVTP